MSKYLCKNYGSCGKADAREPIELIPGSEPVCSECTFKLEPMDDGSDPIPAYKKYVLAGIAALVVVAGAGGWYLFSPATKGKTDSASAVIVTPAVTPTATGAAPDEKQLAAQKQEADKKILEANSTGAVSTQKAVIANEYVKAAIPLMQAGKWEEADAQLLKAKSENPDEPLIYYNQAIIYLKQARDKDAMAALETALQKGFRDFSALESDVDLKPLTGKPEYVAMIGKFKGK